MARQSEVTEWILKNQNALDLQVTKLTWIDRALPGYVDLAVSIKVGAIRTEGRGTDKSEEVALGKAVCEAIERVFCIEKSIPSTGLAGHLSMDLAKVEAKKEFIERATLAQHLSSKIPFQLISKKPVQISLMGKVLAGHVHHFRLSVPSEFEVALVLYEATAAASAFGGVLGIGCESTYEEALTKAEIEALRSVAALDKVPITPLNYQEFQSIPSRRGEHRKRLLINPDYCRNLLEKIRSFSNSVSQSAVEDLFFEDMGHPANLPAGCPLHFVRCYSKQGLDESLLEFVG